MPDFFQRFVFIKRTSYTKLLTYEKERVKRKRRNKISKKKKRGKKKPSKDTNSIDIEHRYRMVPRYSRPTTIQLITVIRAFTYIDKNQTVSPWWKKPAYYRQTPVPSIYSSIKNSSFGEKERVATSLENETNLRIASYVSCARLHIRYTHTKDRTRACAADGR